MHRLFSLFLCLCLGLPAAAQERQKLGYGRLITNDVLGDGQDRWQTGSIQSSRVWGPAWTGTAPDRPGPLLELRLQGQVIAPESLTRPARGDRPYANALSVGLHTHYQFRGIEVAAGADLVLTGEQTGLTWLQDNLHDALGIAGPSRAVRARAIGDGLHARIVIEAAHSLHLGEAVTLRPFVEGRYGVEDLIRAGADLTIGRIGTGELLVRDAVTGQRYRTVRQPARGTAFVLGGDVAMVSDSIFLPGAVTPRDTRSRLRAGFHWDTGRARGFYGLTWLGPEFTGQRTGQLVGSVRLNIDF